MVVLFDGLLVGRLVDGWVDCLFDLRSVLCVRLLDCLLVCSVAWSSVVFGAVCNFVELLL